MNGERDYEKMSVAEQIREGLRESIAHGREKMTLRTTTLPRPAPKLSGRRVASIRKKAGMSQAVFARFLNVPTRTVQSWEQGARTPKAGEARLLQIVEAAPGEVEELVYRVSSGSSDRSKQRSVAR
jgi:putative transcriptional regulator